MKTGPIRMLCLLLFSGYFHGAMAQNLVPNSSFSETDSLGPRYWQKMEEDSLHLYENNGEKDSAVYFVAELQGKSPNSTTYFGWGEKDALVVELTHRKNPLQGI